MGMKPLLTLETDIPYGTGSGRDLLLDVLRPDVPMAPPRPAVIWVHGGGWRGGSREPNPNPLLARRGFVTASIGYRLSDEAIFPAQIHDVKAAIRFLRHNANHWGIDPERIGIWGHSAGGHLAALMAVSAGLPALEGEGGCADESSEVQAAAPMSPTTDFLVDWYRESGLPVHEDGLSAIAELLDGLDLDDPVIRDRAALASPVAMVTAEAAPMLIVHGSDDDLVPIRQARKLVEGLTKVGVEASLLELPGIGHSREAMIGPEEAPISAVRKHVLDFFVRMLGPVPKP